MKIEEFLTRIDLDNSKDTIFKAVKKEFHGEKDVPVLVTRMDLQSGNGSVSAILKSTLFPMNKIFVMQPSKLKGIVEVSSSITLQGGYTMIAKGDDSELEWHLASDETPEIKQQMDENKMPFINPAKFSYANGVKLTQALVNKIIKYHSLVNIGSFQFLGDGKQVRIIGRAADGENRVVLATLPFALTYDEYYDASLNYVLKVVKNTDSMLFLGHPSKKDNKVPPVRIMVEDGDAEINYFVERVLPPSTKVAEPTGAEDGETGEEPAEPATTTPEPEEAHADSTPEDQLEL